VIRREIAAAEDVTTSGGLSEWQCLGVAVDPLQLDSARLRLAAPGGKALRRDVERDDVRARLSGAGSRRVSGPSRHISTRCPGEIHTHRPTPGRSSR
jgi:hypothetical protein